jgi:hypothetical protein
VSYGILCHYGNFLDGTSSGISEQILSWMMDEFIHWPKPYLLLLATCDETLSRMIEGWMKNNLVNDRNPNIANLESPKNIHKE